jgi:hypothetical protein
MEVAPPSYTASVPLDGPPPAYTFPTTFTIGTGKTQAPLVTPEQLKGHLGLLRLFYNLRETVEVGKDDRLPDWARKLEPELRWAWFVNLAAERYVDRLQRASDGDVLHSFPRFERWCKAVRYAPLDQFVNESLPPVDVIMVWHLNSYLV